MRHRNRHYLRMIASTALLLGMASNGLAQDIQHYGPVKTYTKPLPDQKFFSPSITKKLPAGYRVAGPPMIMDGSVVIQRLTERSYWVMLGSHSTTVFVGDKGVLLVDAPIVASTDKLMGAIKQITDLPIHALVYSHPHTDHNGGAKGLTVALKAQGIDLRVITSENGAEEIRRFRSLQEPTQVLPNGRATFQFEEWSFRYVTPVRWAHTGGDSYTISPDGVLTAVDFIYPGALPFQSVSGVQNMTGYLEFVRHLAGETDWKVANLGHANVGYPEDAFRTLEYFEDLYTTWAKIVGPTTHDPYPGEQGVDNAAVSLRIFFDRSSEKLATALKEKWGHVPQFEVVRDHAIEVHKDMYLNYAGWEGKLPSFEPITPDK